MSLRDLLSLREHLQWTALSKSFKDSSPAVIEAAIEQCSVQVVYSGYFRYDVFDITDIGWFWMDDLLRTVARIVRLGELRFSLLIKGCIEWYIIKTRSIMIGLRQNCLGSIAKCDLRLEDFWWRISRFIRETIVFISMGWLIELRSNWVFDVSGESRSPDRRSKLGKIIIDQLVESL
jgi:hypothetical protein